MSSQRHYPHAPITEAVIDIRVNLPEDTPLETLRAAGEQFSADYPDEKKFFEATGHFQFRQDAGSSASTNEKHIGYKRISIDGKQIVQFRLNGFTFSRLAPYYSWEDLRNEAQRLWKVYREKLKPILITRLAVRYINRIDVPGLSVDLSEYFRTAPQISPDLPQQLEGFFMQLRLPLKDLSGKMIVNQTIIPPPGEGVLSIVLDFDLFRDEGVPQDEASIWEYLEILRTRKNEVFEASITDSARKLFE